MDNDLKGLGIAIPSILLPDEKTNMKKWAVVACDQFTSDAKYWSDVEKNGWQCAFDASHDFT